MINELSPKICKHFILFTCALPATIKSAHILKVIHISPINDEIAETRSWRGMIDAKEPLMDLT